MKATSAPRYREEQPNSFEAVVDRVRAELSLPGVAAGVIKRGAAPDLIARGWADVASQRPMEITTPCRVGSITKTLTTLCVLRLVDDGLVGLDDPIRKHLDVEVAQPAGSTPITIRHLLTHTSGIGELASWRALWHPLWAVGGHPSHAKPPDLGTLASSGYRTKVPPETKWVYANPAFTLLGVLVEQLNGCTFSEVVTRTVLEPCAMHCSTFDPDAVDLATPYRLRDGEFEAVRPFGVATLSAGGLITTAEDLARYASMLLDQGEGERGRVVSASILSEAFSVQYRPHPLLAGIGLTFRIVDTDHGRVLGHNGGMPGWNAGLVLCPEQGIAAVALVNRAVAPSAEFGGGRVARGVLSHTFANATPQPQPRSATAGRAADYTPEPLRSGCYRPKPGLLTNIRAFAFFGGELELRQRDGKWELLGLGGSLRGRRSLCENDNGTWGFTFRGVAFAMAQDGRELVLEGIPTAFHLQPISSVRRWRLWRHLALGVLGGTGTALVWSRRRNFRHR